MNDEVKNKLLTKIFHACEENTAFKCRICERVQSIGERFILEVCSVPLSICFACIKKATDEVRAEKEELDLNKSLDAVGGKKKVITLESLALEIERLKGMFHGLASTIPVRIEK